MPANLNKINELIDSIRFQTETYGMDRSIQPPFGPKNTPKQQLKSARQTFIDLKILMCRLEHVLWSGKGKNVKDEEAETEIFDRNSC